MTNNEVLNLTVGTKIRGYSNGRSTDYTITKVGATGRCTNEKSKCFGHAYASVDACTSYGGEYGFCLESDEYIRGEGYQTHGANGVRLTGWEIVA
jgi:hypothetical protein